MTCAIAAALIGCATFPDPPDRNPTIAEVVSAYLFPSTEEGTAVPETELSGTPVKSVAKSQTYTTTVTAVMTGTVSATAGTTTTRIASTGAQVTRTAVSISTRTATPTFTVRPTRRVQTTPPPTRTSTPTRQQANTATPTRRIDPTPEKTPTSPPSPPEAPIQDDVYIRSHRSTVEGGNYVVVGEIINGRAFPVYGAKIIGTFFDNSGTVVGAQEELTLFPKTDIEESNPFKLSVTDPSGQIERYELTLVWEDISIIEFLPVDVRNTKLEEEDGLTVSGELGNSQGTELTSIIVGVTFYDEDGNVVAVFDQFFGSESLAPGETMPYSISIAGPDFEYETFRVQAQGNVDLF